MERLLTAKQVADVVGCHPRTPFLWAAEGRLPAVRIGRRMVRFRVEDVEEFVRAHLEPAR